MCSKRGLRFRLLGNKICVRTWEVGRWDVNKVLAQDQATWKKNIRRRRGSSQLCVLVVFSASSLLTAYLNNVCLSDGLAAFRTFLKSEFSDENIEFWMACEEYKKIKNSSKLLSKANKIYKEFIDSQAPREVCASNQLYITHGGAGISCSS